MLKAEQADAANDAAVNQMDDGADLLRDAVVDELRKNPGRIAKTLIERSEAGDPQITKVVMAIVNTPGRKRRVERPSTALAIACDDEWPVAMERASGSEAATAAAAGGAC